MAIIDFPVWFSMARGYWSLEYTATVRSLAGAQEASLALRVQHGQEGQGSEWNPNDIKQLLGRETLKGYHQKCPGKQNTWSLERCNQIIGKCLLPVFIGGYTGILSKIKQPLATVHVLWVAVSNVYGIYAVQLCSIECLWIFSAAPSKNVKQYMGYPFENLRKWW